MQHKIGKCNFLQKARTCAELSFLRDICSLGRNIVCVIAFEFLGKIWYSVEYGIGCAKLDELLEVTHENNKILRSMRRAQRWSSFFTFLYWTIILGSIFGVYYYFQPTIQKYMKTFQTSIGIIQNFEKSAGSIPTDVQSVKNLIGK